MNISFENSLYSFSVCSIDNSALANSKKDISPLVIKTVVSTGMISLSFCIH